MQKEDKLQIPEKAHPMCEFVIAAKFSGHVLRRLASSLSNVIW